MIGALETVSRLCAIGLGLEEAALSTLMHEAPHLLAPTGEKALFALNDIFKPKFLAIIVCQTKKSKMAASPRPLFCPPPCRDRLLVS